MKRMKGWMNEHNFVIPDFNKKSETTAIKNVATAMNVLAFINHLHYNHFLTHRIAEAALSEDMQCVWTVIQ